MEANNFLIQSMLKYEARNHAFSEKGERDSISFDNTGAYLHSEMWTDVDKETKTKVKYAANENDEETY